MPIKKYFYFLFFINIFEYNITQQEIQEAYYNLEENKSISGIYHPILNSPSFINQILDFFKNNFVNITRLLLDALTFKSNIYNLFYAKSFPSSITDLIIYLAGFIFRLIIDYK
jgi:hypothetical protein